MYHCAGCTLRLRDHFILYCTASRCSGSSCGGAPSNFKFVARQPPAIAPGQAYAYDFCHGTPVKLPEGNKTNWEMFAKDNAQGECNGPFDKEPTQVSGTDAPVQFGLASGGGFQPIGMCGGKRLQLTRKG